MKIRSLILIAVSAIAPLTMTNPSFAKSSEVTHQIETAIKEIVMEKIGLEAGQYISYYDFFELGADRLDLIDIYTAVEEKYGISLPIDAEETIRSPLALIDFVDASINQ